MSNSLVTIPLSQLRPSAANIRRTDADVDLKSLAASIQAHGLLQNLTVKLAGRARRGKKPRYEVVAGGRRLSALRLLVRRKRIPANFAVPCRLLGDDESATAAEISLAENVVRAPVHPADQFDAFSKLQQEGRGPEEIAARFGVSPTVVLQRLKLATVSPRLMATYREGAMNLDQLSAFAISDDHEAQERVWFDDPNRYTLPGKCTRP